MKDRPRLTKDGELRTPTETRKAAKQVTDGVLNGTHYIEIDGVKKHIKFDMTRNRTLTRKQVMQFSWIIMLMDHKDEYEFYCKKILKEIYPWIPHRNIIREYNRAFKKKGDYILKELI